MAQQPRQVRAGRVIAIVLGALVLMFVIMLAVGLLNVGNQAATTNPPTAADSTGPAAAPESQTLETPGIERLTPGQCVRVIRKAGTTPNPDGSVEIDHRTVVCDSDEDLVYTVASVHVGQLECPTDTYLEYYQTTAPHGQSEAPSDRRFTACLMPNLKAGSCYAKNTESVGYRTVECADPAAVFGISEAFEQADASLCGDHAPDALVYAEPPRTYCRAATG